MLETLYFSSTHRGLCPQFILATKDTCQCLCITSHFPFLNGQLYLTNFIFFISFSLTIGRQASPTSATARHLPPRTLVTTQPTQNPNHHSLVWTSSICIYIYIYVCIYTDIFLCIDIYTYMCVCEHMYIYIYSTIGTIDDAESWVGVLGVSFGWWGFRRWKVGRRCGCGGGMMSGGRGAGVNAL